MKLKLGLTALARAAPALGAPRNFLAQIRSPPSIAQGGQVWTLIDYQQTNTYN